MTRATSKNPPMCGDWQKYEKQSFVLEAGELRGRSIQDIYHVCDARNSMDKRRVYGVEPVNCILQAVNSQGSYQMKLCINQ